MRALVSYAALVLAAVILAACGALPFDSAQGRLAQDDTSPPAGSSRVSPISDAARAVAHFVQRPVHSDHGKSWMDPAYGIASAHKKKSLLLYVADDSTNDVYVYDYRSDEQVGQLTGFDGPFGMCVDAKGDVYVANFDAGTVAEYAHGGTTAINVYDSGGEPIGCAVDAAGDLAVTSFDPGEVTVYTGGNPNDASTYSNADCGFIWSMGYDDKGNLVGIGESSSNYFCAVLAGSKSMQTLEADFTIAFAGGTMWDGKHFAFADQELGGQFQTGIIRAKLSGTTLTKVGETALSDDCYSNYVDVVNPFIVGKKNTPVNHKQGTVVLGPNLWCTDAGTTAVDYWHYPAGALPFKRLSALEDPYGAAASIGT